jgi:hypothetical protein
VTQHQADVQLPDITEGRGGRAPAAYQKSLRYMWRLRSSRSRCAHCVSLVEGSATWRMAGVANQRPEVCPICLQVQHLDLGLVCRACTFEDGMMLSGGSSLSQQVHCIKCRNADQLLTQLSAPRQA